VVTRRGSRSSPYLAGENAEWLRSAGHPPASDSLSPSLAVLAGEIAAVLRDDVRGTEREDRMVTPREF
jgi:hypothetical protein